MVDKQKVNFVCYSKIPSELQEKYEITWNGIKENLHGGIFGIKVANDFSDFKPIITGTLSPISKDLVDIASATYLADKLIEQEPGGIRELNILIPVRAKILWESKKKLLKKMLQFLIRDNINFYFEEINEKEEFIKSNNTEGYGSVVCFSGGLDSYIGAIQTIKDGKNPILVSQYSHPRGGKLKGIQTNVHHSLEEYYDRKIPHCYVLVAKGSKYNPKQNTQFSRSFLFLSLATAIASELEIQEVLMCENGILALNIPITSARINTRTAHPKFLLMYQDFIKEILDKKIEINNPFIYKTKTEIARLHDVDKINFLNQTVSCWRYWKQEKSSSHCGYCIPCIIRRISVENAFPFEVEPEGTYQIDIFKDYPYKSLDEKHQIEAFLNVNDLINFSARIISLTQKEIQFEYPDMYINNLNQQEITNMYSRFAKEIIDIFRKKGNVELNKFIESMNR